MKIEMVEAIRRKIQDSIGEIHTAMPGQILDVDYDEGTCSVQPYAMYKTVTGDKIKYPALYHVPIVVPQSSVADTCVAYPILPGDNCLLIISEGTINYWLYNRVTDLDSKFDLSNAICIPGLTRQFNPCFKEAAHDGAVILKYGGGKLKLTNDTLMIRAKNLDIEATGNIEMRATGAVSVTSGGNLGISASGNTTITGSRVDIN